MCCRLTFASEVGRWSFVLTAAYLVHLNCMCFHEYSAYNWVIWKLFLEIFGCTKCWGFKLFPNIMGMGSFFKLDQYYFLFIYLSSSVTFLLAYMNQNSSASVRLAVLSPSGKDLSQAWVTTVLFMSEVGCGGISLSLPVKHFLKMHNQPACLAICSCQQKLFIYRFSSCFLLPFGLIDPFCLSFSGASLAL